MKNRRSQKINHIEGESREQITLFPEAIEEYITEENLVRFIDAFVEGLNFNAMEFEHTELNVTGRPPYNPKDLLKLYIYGYLNRIRSSRQLEKESKRNLEVMWLLKRLMPDHKTISNFRQKNVEKFKEVFKQFIVICRELELFGEELIAIDSTKFKAQNSRDGVKDKDGIKKGMEKIEARITTRALAQRLHTTLSLFFLCNVIPPLMPISSWRDKLFVARHLFSRHAFVVMNFAREEPPSPLRFFCFV